MHSKTKVLASCCMLRPPRASMPKPKFLALRPRPRPITSLTGYVISKLNYFTNDWLSWKITYLASQQGLGFQLKAKANGLDFKAKAKNFDQLIAKA